MGAWVGGRVCMCELVWMGAWVGGRVSVEHYSCNLQGNCAMSNYYPIKFPLSSWRSWCMISRACVQLDIVTWLSRLTMVLKFCHLIVLCAK